MSDLQTIGEIYDEFHDATWENEIEFDEYFEVGRKCKGFDLKLKNSVVNVPFILKVPKIVEYYIDGEDHSYLNHFGSIAFKIVSWDKNIWQRVD